MGILKRFSFMIVVFVMIFASSNAYGVTAKKGVFASKQIGWVSSQINGKAECEIQIRKLKKMMGSYEVDLDTAFDKLENLQKKLQGTK